MTLFWLGTAWLAGIAAGKLFGLQIWQWLVLAVIALAASLVFRRERGWRWLFACAAVAAMGASRLRAAIPTVGPDHIANYNDSGQNLTITGVIVDFPDVRDSYVGLRVEGETLGSAWGESREIHGLVLVRAPRFADYAYGDRVRVSGFLETPPEFEDFSYRDYLARQGVHSLMNRVSVERLASRQANPFLQLIFDYRSRALEVVYDLFPDPEASLLAGILLGVESGITQEVREEFNATGTTHIIAISGFNITIIAGLFVSLLGRWLGARRGALAAGMAILVYTILVGADAAVVRAAIMGGLALAARRLGRESEGLTALTASAVAMTLFNPQILWDVGFQLSFAATLGLILYGERLHNGFVNFCSRWLSVEKAERLARPVSEFVLFTLAAQVTTLPLMALHFNRLSLVSLIANPIILPVQPAVMILGGLTVILGSVWLPLGRLLALIAWPAPAFTIRAVCLMARLPGASVSLGTVGAVAVGAYYLLLFALTLWRRLPPERRMPLPRIRIRAATSLGLLVGMTVLAWKAAAGVHDGRLHVTVLDVGQGDAVLIESPDGRFVIVDGGGSPLALADSLGRRLPLLHREIDWIVVAATGEEHVGGLTGIVERHRVGSVLMAGQPGGSAYRQLVEEFRQARVPIIDAAPGMSLDLGAGAWLEVVAVGAKGAMLQIEFERTTFLLCPGADPEMISNLLVEGRAKPVSAALLADGGYEGVNPPSWLRELDPLVALISVEAGNRDGLPSPAVLSELEGTTVLRTDQHGWIEWTSDGVRVWIEVERH
jgi:competence protein ComEC